MFKVQRIEQNSLIKHEYNFRLHSCGTLRYESYYKYTRKSKREKWADEWPKPLSYESWCKKNRLDEDDYISESKYQDYENKLNPVMRGKLTGLSTIMINHLPKCPKDVAEEVLQLCRDSLRVVYYERTGQN